ncbi:hypothetical protein CS006_04240 [Bifidobacterium primatium]|uniref:Uncharacterized protein n=1 Tax=Bifidobacterium primatium TaxID=2045438 RepID=A0A2M9H8X7_9BIFI|nr:hypothetical protein [Bifidobacterium primatium]PJM73264.1 hypothetical protein CS006_04240 [Bifidobacterium primatium]
MMKVKTVSKARRKSGGPEFRDRDMQKAYDEALRIVEQEDARTLEQKRRAHNNLLRWLPQNG